MEKSYLRTLLLKKFDWMESRVMALARQHGYEQVTPAMGRMFGYMSSRPTGLSDLARSLGVSRQALHRLAKDAAELGLVEFVPTVGNAKVVRLQFTAAGWAMSAQAAADFDAIEVELAAVIGQKGLAELKRLLSLSWSEEAS